MRFRNLDLSGRTFAAVGFAALLAGCGGGGGPTTSAPAATTQSASAASPGGALPASGAGAATLSWRAPLDNIDGSTLVDLAGFRIYYGRSAESLTSSIVVTNASVSTFVVESLAAGTWYFAVSAVNRQGTESPLSNVATKTIS